MLIKPNLSFFTKKEVVKDADGNSKVVESMSCLGFIAFMVLLITLILVECFIGAWIWQLTLVPLFGISAASPAQIFGIQVLIGILFSWKSDSKD